MYAKKFAEYNSDEIDQVIMDMDEQLNTLKTLNAQCKQKCQMLPNSSVVVAGSVITDSLPYDDTLGVVSSMEELNRQTIELKIKSSSLQSYVQKQFNLVFAYIPDKFKPSVLYELSLKK